MITRLSPDWHLRLTAPPRTTHAGRIALPIAFQAPGQPAAVVDLILDGAEAIRLHAALTAHLSGRGAGPDLAEACAAIGAAR